MLGNINYLIGPIEYDLVLTKPNKEPISPVSDNYNNIYIPSMVAVGEFSFNIDKFFSDGSVNPSYALVKEKFLIRLNQQEFFVINEITEDEIEGVKEIICYSLEFELSQKFIQAYEATSAKLYSDNSDIPGVMNLINSLAPSWTVGNIDSEILTRYRSFDVSNIDIYSFIVKNIQDSFGCIAIFNTDDKTIDFKLLENIGINNSLYLSSENLVNQLIRERKLENIATRVYGFGSEDLTMNTVNPYGGKSWIDNFSYFRTREWMSQGLIDALDSHDAIVAANITEFQTVLADYQTEFEDKYGSDENRTLLATLISGSNVTFDDSASDVDNYYNGWELLIDLPSSANVESAGQTATIVSYNGTTKIATLNSAFSQVLHTYQTVQVVVIDIPENPVVPAVYAEGNYFISEDIGNYKVLQLALNKQAYFQEQEIALIAKHASITPDQDDLDQLAEVRTHLDYWDAEVVTYQALVDANDAILDAKTTRLSELNDIMDIENNLTFAELQELDSYIIETTHTNSTIVDENDLYNEVKEVSDRIAYPRYEFHLTASDFLKMVEYQHIRHRLNIGDLINIEISDTEVVEVRLISYTHDYDGDSLDMVFSSVNSLYDSTYELAELLDNTNSAAGTLSTERFKYKTYVDNDQNTILQFMESELDAALNAVLAGNNQEIIIDRTGITLREYDSITGGYKDEQMRLINNTIAISDDNWNTVKTAISPSGVFADVLVGRAILGTELQIEAADGTFVVDDLGTVLKNMSLTAVYDEGLGTERKIVLNGTDVIRVSIGGVDKLWIDGNGDLNVDGNITLGAGSVVSWSAITDADTNSLAAWTASGYATYIDGTGIYTGTLTANNILAGTLGSIGESITLGSNVTVEADFVIEWTDGLKLSTDGLTGYVGGLQNGPTISAGEKGIFFYSDNAKKGELDFDLNPDPEPGDSADRMFLRTSTDVALKLESVGDADVSIVAGGGDIWLDGNLHLLPEYKIYAYSGTLLIGEESAGLSLTHSDLDPLMPNAQDFYCKTVELDGDRLLHLSEGSGTIDTYLLEIKADGTMNVLDYLDLNSDLLGNDVLAIAKIDDSKIAVLCSNNIDSEHVQIYIVGISGNVLSTLTSTTITQLSTSYHLDPYAPVGMAYAQGRIYLQYLVWTGADHHVATILHNTGDDSLTYEGTTIVADQADGTDIYYNSNNHTIFVNSSATQGMLVYEYQKEVRVFPFAISGSTITPDVGGYITISAEFPGSSALKTIYGLSDLINDDRIVVGADVEVSLGTIERHFLLVNLAGTLLDSLNFVDDTGFTSRYFDTSLVGNTLFVAHSDQYTTGLRMIHSFTIGDTITAIGTPHLVNANNGEATYSRSTRVSASSARVVLFRHSDLINIYQSGTGDIVSDAVSNIYHQYSIDGLVDWHDVYTNGDLFIRHKINDNDWGSAERNIDLVSVKGGQDAFLGSSTATTITHELGSAPISVVITPLGNPSGALGEVWIDNITATTFDVYCSGVYTGNFKWMAMI